MDRKQQPNGSDRVELGKAKRRPGPFVPIEHPVRPVPVVWCGERWDSEVDDVKKLTGRA